MQIKIGFDERTYGFICTAGKQLQFFPIAGATAETLQQTAQEYAVMLVEHGGVRAEDVKGEDVLKLMVQRMRGRSWAVEVEPAA